MCAVRERADIEVKTKFTVEVRKHIQVEFGSNTGTVVVGALDDGRVFLQIDTNQHCAINACLLVHDSE